MVFPFMTGLQIHSKHRHSARCQRLCQYTAGGFILEEGGGGGLAALHSEEMTGAGADVTETGVQISRFSESVLDGDCDDGLSFWSRIPWRRRRRKRKGCHGAPSRAPPPQLPLVFVLHWQEWEIILFHFNLKGALNSKYVLPWSQ